MTPSTALRRFASPLIASVTTAAALTGVLWVQHGRNGWPFAPPDQAAAGMIADDDLESMEPAIPGATPTRVPIDVTAVNLEELGIRVEEVRRESLTEAVRAVATVVPDESRISQVHTRVSGWIEQLDVNTTGEAVRAGQPGVGRRLADGERAVAARAGERVGHGGTPGVSVSRWRRSTPRRI